MSRNPYYIDGEEPTLRKSVFVFMDILGYGEIIRSSELAGTQQQLLRSVHNALSVSREWLEGRKAPDGLRKITNKDYYALKAFTDNIVIGWPVHDDAEPELGLAFLKLGFFQLQMVIKGYFIRGALAVGEAYVDEIAVFGSALIEAHEGESKIARDPRIILTESAIATTKQHLRYYGDGRCAPHAQDVLCDSDGQWFLNYLDCVLWEDNPYYDFFEQHKLSVEEKLKQHRKNPPIWSKYAWVAAYHNYFCDLHSQYFNEQYKINVDLFRKSPGSILEE